MSIFEEVTKMMSANWSDWDDMKEGWYVDVASGTAFVASPLAKEYPIYILDDADHIRMIIVTPM